jgi:hypothetical protein
MLKPSTTKLSTFLALYHRDSLKALQGAAKPCRTSTNLVPITRRVH